MMNFIKDVFDHDLGTLIAMAVGYLGGKALEKVYDAAIDKAFSHISEKYRKKKFKKLYDAHEKLVIEKHNIMPIDHADPFYEHTDIEIINTGKKFCLDCPEPYKQQIKMKRNDISFERDFFFSKYTGLEDLDEITGIGGLAELIVKHKEITGQWFLNELDKAYPIFNGKKFGIYSIRSHRLRETEDAGLSIEFYETDYFTHKVMRSVYQELKSLNHPICNMKTYPVEGIDHLRPFMTSFGVNTFLIVYSEKGDKSIVFAKRSKRTANTRESIWHVTMNEGLSFTDIEGKDISLVKCLHRGLNEELGIKEHYYKDIEKEKFMDLFLVMDNFEVGISSVVVMDASEDKIKDLHSIAKDSVLETEEICAVDFNSRDINRFISENKCTSACLYTLSMVMLRKRYL